MQVRRVEIVKRDDIPSLNAVVVEDTEHLLGILKDFRKSDALSRFLPAETNLSAAWVHLDAGQVLDAHLHPVDSMIIVCRGDVAVFGEIRADMSDGDILLVPRGHRHGLVGAGASGFWGLSVQLEQQGLYEDSDRPHTVFLDDEPSHAADPALDLEPAAKVGAEPLATLLARNQHHLDEFSRNPLFDLARSGALKVGSVRERFLDAFQVWSDHFQRMVQLRAGLAQDSYSQRIASVHLRDELGHNEKLANGRAINSGARFWDPVLEGACSWFLWRMMTLGDIERTVLVHLVIEGSAVVFYRHMREYVSASDMDEHVAAHDVDDQHVRLGIEALEGTRLTNLESLMRVQNQGWQMLNSMFARIADLAQSYPIEKSKTAVGHLRPPAASALPEARPQQTRRFSPG